MVQVLDESRSALIEGPPVVHAQRARRREDFLGRERLWKKRAVHVGREKACGSWSTRRVSPWQMIADSQDANPPIGGRIVLSKIGDQHDRRLRLGPEHDAVLAPTCRFASRDHFFELVDSRVEISQLGGPRLVRLDDAYSHGLVAVAGVIHFEQMRLSRFLDRNRVGLPAQIFSLPVGFKLHHGTKEMLDNARSLVPSGGPFLQTLETRQLGETRKSLPPFRVRRINFLDDS